MKNTDWDEWWNGRRPIRKSVIEFLMKIYFKNIFVKHIKRFLLKSDSILEFGCGSGHIINQLVKEGYAVTGIDYSPVAPSHCSSGTFVFFTGDIRDEAFRKIYRNKKFDLVYSQGVMEHYSDAEFKEILKAMVDVAKKVLIFVPSDLSVFRIYDPTKDDINKRFLSKEKFEELLSNELHGITVKHIPATGFLSIMAFGIANT